MPIVRGNKILLGAAIGAIAGVLVSLVRVPLPSLPVFESDHVLLGHRPLLLACVAMWAIFGVYWDAAGKKTAPTKTSETRGSRAIHVALANIALLLEIAPIRGLGRFLPASVIIMGAGLAVEFAGLFLAIWARRHLGQYWSGEISIKVKHELIRSGPYGTLRHPIYTGLLLMYAGVAAVTGEWLALIGLGMAVFAYVRKIRLEELNLNSAFGLEYDAYRRATWALVPGIF